MFVFSLVTVFFVTFATFAKASKKGNYIVKLHSETQSLKGFGFNVTLQDQARVDFNLSWVDPQNGKEETRLSIHSLGTPCSNTAGSCGMGPGKGCIEFTSYNYDDSTSKTLQAHLDFSTPYYFELVKKSNDPNVPFYKPCGQDSTMTDCWKVNIYDIGRGFLPGYTDFPSNDPGGMGCASPFVYHGDVNLFRGVYPIHQPNSQNMTKDLMFNIDEDNWPNLFECHKTHRPNQKVNRCHASPEIHQSSPLGYPAWLLENIIFS